MTTIPTILTHNTIARLRHQIRTRDEVIRRQTSIITNLQKDNTKDPELKSLLEMDFLEYGELILLKLRMFYSYASEHCLKTRSRKHELVIVRQLWQTFMCERGFTLESIGIFCGGRDHSTVLHSKSTIYDLIDTNRIIREQYTSISEYLSGRKNPVKFEDAKDEIKIFLDQYEDEFERLFEAEDDWHYVIEIHTVMRILYDFQKHNINKIKELEKNDLQIHNSLRD